MRNLTATEICLIIFISACLGWIYGLLRLQPTKEVATANVTDAPIIKKPPALPRPSASIDNVRYLQTDQSISVIVDITGSVRFKTGDAKSPERFYLDVKQARLNSSLKPKLEIPSGPLREIRVGQYDESTVRILLDGITSKEVQAEKLSGPARIVLNITPPAASPGLKKTVVAAAPVKPAISLVAADAVREVVSMPETARSLLDSSDAGLRDATSNRSPARKRPRVVIDAGHGGHDSGSVGPTGFAEKELVLDLSKRLKTLLELELGTEVVLTRNEDTFIALENRTQTANRVQADLFISLHANSSPKNTVQGAETFVLNLITGSRDALTTASRENASYGRRINDLPDILSTIASNDKARESLAFANHVQTALSPRSIKGTALGVLGAPLAVLIGARMPAVFVEVSYISNPEEEQRLRTSEYRQQLAESLFKGIKSYADTFDSTQTSNLAKAR